MIIRVCRFCFREIPPERRQLRGWCEVCYLRWHKAGKPASGPPLPRVKFADRVEDVKEMLGQGETTAAIAQRLGLSVLTVREYVCAARKSLVSRNAPDLPA